jgi:hypothetical protein
MSLFQQQQKVLNQVPPKFDSIPVGHVIEPSVQWVGPSGKKVGFHPTSKEVISGGYRPYNPKGLNDYRTASSGASQFGDLLGAGATILGSASAAAPALAPVAAGLGVGYGVYKLGQSFKLW